MATLKFPVEDIHGHSVWPEKFSDEELADKRDKLELQYHQEYLVTPTSLYGSELQLSWLKLYDHDRLTEDGVFEECEYYFGVDPSITGYGDYCAIAIVARSKGKLFLIDFVREKAPMERIIELIQRTARIYPPTIINVESVQAQQYIVQELINETLLPVRGYVPKGKKEDRISVMAQVRFQTGQVLVRGKRDEDLGGLVFDERMTSFKQEWLAFPRGKHDDTLDATESALEIAASSGIAACLSSEISIDSEGKEYENTAYKPRQRSGWY